MTVDLKRSPLRTRGGILSTKAACSDHVGACGFRLVLTAAGTFHLATPLYVRVAPVSSTSPEPSCNAPFANLVSGRDSTPGMRPRPNHQLFVIQVLSSWVVRPADDGGFTTFPASYNGWDIINETACSDHVGACGFPLVLTAAGTFHLATPLYVRVAPVLSTSPEPSCNAPFANLVSGRDSTPGMRPRPNHLLFVIRVGKDRFYFYVKSNNVCLVVLPRPRAFLKCGSDFFDSLCLIVLLLSGDVELNPGPFSEAHPGSTEFWAKTWVASGSLGH
ncbi:uncharacterized protein ISCGN_031633 [Ixodes scapularis]